jgi:Tfp pilus assembly protein PilE
MTKRGKIILIVGSVIGICVLLVLGVLAGAAVMGWRAAVRAGNEAATLQNLKTIAAVEVQYFNTHKRTFGTFDQLISEQFISARFAGHPSVVDGYVFNLSVARKADDTSSYKITADPQDDEAGREHFYIDSHDGGIHANSERQAGPDDPLM